MFENVTVTKVFHFAYAHFLPNYEGPCARIHGHTAKVEVTFTHHPLLETYPEMVLDFKTIKKYVDPIICELDHQFLNERVPELGVPTVENIGGYIARRILGTPLGRALVCVHVSESEDSYATVSITELQRNVSDRCQGRIDK